MGRATEKGREQGDRQIGEQAGHRLPTLDKSG